MKDIHAIRLRYVEVLSVIAVLAFPLVIEAAELENPDVRIEGEYIFSADVGDSSPTGEVEETFARIVLSLPIHLSESSNLEIRILGEQAFFNWSEPHKIAFSNGREPWDNLYSSNIGLRWLYKWNGS